MMKWLLMVAISFSPAAAMAQATDFDVLLIWEADTYTPPFYRGHSQPSPNNTVRIVALPMIPPGKTAPALANFDFAWTKDDLNISSASGPGRNQLEYLAGAAGEINAVTVKISRAGKIVVERTITIKAVEPRLLIYENKPLEGINYNQAIGERFALSQPEITLLAEPYYFSRPEASARLIDFEWLLNGKKVISHPDDPRFITFAPLVGGAGGENTIAVSAKNTRKILEAARHAFIIAFGQHQFNF